MQYEIKKIEYLKPFTVVDNNIYQEVTIMVGIVGDTYEFTRSVYHIIKNIPKNYTVDTVITYVADNCASYIQTLYPNTD